MTRSIRLAALLLTLLAAPLSGQAQTIAAAYVPGTEDVPLMPGLASDAAAGLVFDKPQGRIVEASARGAVSRRAVLAFYQESLPQLGWHPAGERHFQRDGERLSLDFDGSDGNLEVGFTLAPH
jgi:hypothetical protein